MSEANEFRAYFTVTGDFDPAEITAMIGLQPTEAYRKGDVFGRTKQLQHKFSRWSLESSLGRENSLEKHVQDVTSQLEPVKDNIAKLGADLGAHVHLVAYFKEITYGFFFEANSIAALGLMKLGVGIALYYEGEEDDAD